MLREVLVRSNVGMAATLLQGDADFDLACAMYGSQPVSPPAALDQLAVHFDASAKNKVPSGAIPLQVVKAGP